MEWVDFVVELLRDVPPPARIVGIAIVVLGISLPLLKGAHPSYILVAFVSLMTFVALVLPVLAPDQDDENETWLRDENLRCVLVSGLNPQGAHNLAVRRGPGTEHEEFTQRYTDQKLWVHGETAGWVLVRFIERGQPVEGWVFRGYTTNTPCR